MGDQAVIAVVALHLKFGMEPRNNTKYTFIIVVEIEGAADSVLTEIVEASSLLPRQKLPSAGMGFKATYLPKL